jgi:capsular exopolysaccharide synthesis family protein
MVHLKEEMTEVVENITKGKKSSFTESDIEGEKAKSQYQHALEGLKANNVSMVAAAQTPIVPVRPNKIFNVFMAMVVGLFGGVGLVFFAECQDSSVKSVEDLESLVDWPFLGQIPKIAGVRKEFHAQKHSGDFITESFRAIRTQLLFLNTKENPVKAVVVTSLGPQEGKTTILCNLGIVLAQNNMKVLLVDADMRKPRLHIIFKRKGTKSFSNFLSGQVEYKDIIQETEVKNLFLVDNNQPPPNPAELLLSEKMKDFVSSVKEDFDFILFDSSPIGMITDATILARMLDGVAVVVEAEKTPKKAALRSDKLFKTSRVKILGAIINRTVISGSDSYYSSYAYSASKR